MLNYSTSPVFFDMQPRGITSFSGYRLNLGGTKELSTSDMPDLAVPQAALWEFFGSGSNSRYLEYDVTVAAILPQLGFWI
jgi:hypothetical protein